MQIIATLKFTEIINERKEIAFDIVREYLN